jgi:hypothetical protein
MEVKNDRYINSDVRHDMRHKPIDYKKLLVHYNLLKHNCTKEELDTKMVNDIIFDERTRLVSLFKDYLLLDEVNDFLKR